jgi:hypothetical protein
MITMRFCIFASEEVSRWTWMDGPKIYRSEYNQRGSASQAPLYKQSRIPSISFFYDIRPLCRPCPRPLRKLTQTSPLRCANSPSPPSPTLLQAPHAKGDTAPQFLVTTTVVRVPHRKLKELVSLPVAESCRCRAFQGEALSWSGASGFEPPSSWSRT